FLHACGAPRILPSFPTRRSSDLSELPGTSVFIRDGGKVFHTYSTYTRGIDMLNVAYHYMDLVPKGRDEGPDGQMGWLHRIWPSRSEEHTSELQSRRDLVCRLLLE